MNTGIIILLLAFAAIWLYLTTKPDMENPEKVYEGKYGQETTDVITMISYLIVLLISVFLIASIPELLANDVHTAYVVARFVSGALLYSLALLGPAKRSIKRQREERNKKIG